MGRAVPSKKTCLSTTTSIVGVGPGPAEPLLLRLGCYLEEKGLRAGASATVALDKHACHLLPLADPRPLPPCILVWPPHSLATLKFGLPAHPRDFLGYLTGWFFIFLACLISSTE